ncbi:MAG: hypothetical protein ACI4SE_03540 [Lachnospiraceae bacterium]
MRIGECQGIIGIHTDSVQQEALQQKDTERTGRTSFQLNGNGQAYDTVTQKKQRAQMQAMKLIRDVYASDLKVDEGLQESRDRIAQLRAESEEAEEKLGEFEKRKNALAQEYGVDKDSTEQKDLELLEKRRELQKRGMGASLTQEEQKRLEQIDREGLTEYQSRCMEFNEQEDPYKDIIEKNRNQIRGQISAISETKLEKLKVRPMLEATQSAEEIMKAASDEALGALVAEGQNYLDEKAKESEEAAQKQKEAKEAKEAKEEQEERVDVEKVTDTAVETDQTRMQTQEDVRKILAKLGMTEEDIKGAAVDELL